MDYKDFVEKVKADLPELLADTMGHFFVSDTQVDKLQGLSYEGIKIVPENSTMSITLDLYPYFEMLEDNVSYDSILSWIAGKTTEAYENRPAISVEDLTDYETVNPRLSILLIGQEGNEERLKQIPHHPMEDLALVYRIRIQENEYGTATALITNAMLDQFGITPEQLHQDALEVAAAENPFAIKTMSEIFAELTGGMFVPEDTIPMYVASNESRINGAGVIAYPNFMETAAEHLNGSFYILPSSIHDVILLPENDAHSVKELQEMVQEINTSQVAPEERLSDHVYHYDCQSKVFERADRYEARKQGKDARGENESNSVLDTLRGHKEVCAAIPHKPLPAHRREEAAL